MGDETFRVIVKRDRLKDEGRRDYSRCYGPPFILQMSGNGLIAPCGFLFNEKYKAFHIGNICDERFKTMYQSERYWEVIRYLASDEFDPRSRCGPNCLQTQTNSFLFHLKEGRATLPTGAPPPHLGFL
jgi:MoaA/NifB/PqqE/SkfB family radical SAM enzyme